MHKTHKYLGLIPKLTSSKKNLFIDSKLWFRHSQRKLFYDYHHCSSICLNKCAYLCICHLYLQHGHSESLGFFCRKKSHSQRFRNILAWASCVFILLKINLALPDWLIPSNLRQLQCPYRCLYNKFSFSLR